MLISDTASYISYSHLDFSLESDLVFRSLKFFEHLCTLRFARFRYWVLRQTITKKLLERSSQIFSHGTPPPRSRSLPESFGWARECVWAMMFLDFVVSTQRNHNVCIRIPNEIWSIYVNITYFSKDLTHFALPRECSLPWQNHHHWDRSKHRRSAPRLHNFHLPRNILQLNSICLAKRHSYSYIKSIYIYIHICRIRHNVMKDLPKDLPRISSYRFIIM